VTSFFDPVPAPPPEARKAWQPPAWDRPSEGTLPAILALGEIVLQSDQLVVQLEHLGVYPNGFTIQLSIIGNPHEQPAGRSTASMVAGDGGALAHRLRFPRVGVQFADGRVGGKAEPGISDTDRDEHGIPVQPIVRMLGGGGGANRGFRYGVWVHPLPPVGPLTIFVSLPSIDDDGSVIVDGEQIRAAAARASVIWS